MIADRAAKALEYLLTLHMLVLKHTSSNLG